MANSFSSPIFDDQDLIGLPHPLHLCEVLIQHTRLAGICGLFGLLWRGSQARNLLCKETRPLKRELLPKAISLLRAEQPRLKHSVK